MNKLERRGFLTGTAGAAGLVMLGGLAVPALAAGPLTVGVLIPGSKSDKGWMESGYDGLQAAEKKLGAKITVKYIENVKFGDMEQVLHILALRGALEGWAVRPIERLPLREAAEIMRTSAIFVAMSRATGEGFALRTAAFSADRTLIAGGFGDSSIQIWSLTDVSLSTTLFGHTAAINALAFWPDTSRLISASDDGTLRVWGVRP